MEELLDKMETAVINTEPKNKSDYECLYKNWGKLSNQEERRRELLEAQKCQRHNKLDKFRGILELVHAVEENDIFRHEKPAYYRPTIYVAGFNKVNFSYNNVLMMSEWMIERPQDLEENWYVTACPKGVRMLVVANGGKTKCFTKYGQFKFQMYSHLPGGNITSNSYSRNSCCVLDCFYHEKNNTMYVIDFLAWNNQPMTDCDTEFRDFWLRSQFIERPQLGVASKKNKMKFVLLPKVPCTKEELDKFMMKYPQFEDEVPPLDGLLFYHKMAHYTSGQTPLVGWLFPYMVPEVLGNDITVHPMYMFKKPKDYVDQATFIKSFDEKLAKRSAWHERISRISASMDTSDSEVKTRKNKDKSAANVNGAGDAPISETEDITNSVDNEPALAKEPKMEADPLPDSTVESPEDTKAMDAEEVTEKQIDYPTQKNEMETVNPSPEPSK